MLSPRALIALWLWVPAKDGDSWETIDHAWKVLYNLLEAVKEAEDTETRN